MSIIVIVSCYTKKTGITKHMSLKY